MSLKHVREISLSLNIYTFSIISSLSCCRDVSQIFISRFSEVLMNRSVLIMHTFGEFNKNQMNRTCLCTRRQIVTNISLVLWIGCCINILQVTTFIIGHELYKGAPTRCRSNYTRHRVYTDLVRISPRN